jgi:hypothetical protein
MDTANELEPGTEVQPVADTQTAKDQETVRQFAAAMEKGEIVDALRVEHHAATNWLSQQAEHKEIHSLNLAISQAEAAALAAQKVLDGAQAELRRLRLDLAEAARSQQHRRNERDREGLRLRTLR